MSIALRRYLAVIAVSALGAGFTGIASAGSDAAASAGADLTTLDTDHDGTVSKKEAAKNKDLNKKFSKLDTNKDGKLDSAEFSMFEAPAADAGSSAPAPANPYEPSSSSTPKP